MKLNDVSRVLSTALLSYLWCTPAYSEVQYFVLPAALRLEGVGGVYGLGAGADKVVGERMKVLVGAAVGSVQAAGIGAADVPLGLENLGLNLGYLHLKRSRLQTSYARGLDPGPDFGQEISGRAFGATVDLRLGNFVLTTGWISSTVNLDDYYLGDVVIERPRTDGYFPVETSSKMAKLTYDAIEKGRGFKVGGALSTAEGRVGQSDSLVTSLSFAAYQPLSSGIQWVSYFNWSDAYIIKKESRYTDENSVLSALNTGCLTSECRELESSIASYIARNNLYGTATPLGGNRGLRAYEEWSLRAAHTRLLSTEVRWNVYQWNNVDLALVPFFDLGWLADQSAQVFDRATYSYGAELRALYKSIPLRLAYARSSEESAWFLAIGQDF